MCVNMGSGKPKKNMQQNKDAKNKKKSSLYMFQKVWPLNSGECASLGNCEQQEEASDLKHDQEISIYFESDSPEIDGVICKINLLII